MKNKNTLSELIFCLKSSYFFYMALTINKKVYKECANFDKNTLATEYLFKLLQKRISD